MIVKEKLRFSITLVKYAANPIESSMTKRKPNPATMVPETSASYLTWADDKGKSLAFAAIGSALQKQEPIVRTKGSDIFFDVSPGNNTSVRDGFARDDYESFRRDEVLPKTVKGSIYSCNEAYMQVGIVRNVIDLMADFAAQGIDLNHPNERIEKFFKEWFRKVHGIERTERFLNNLYRSGNVIVKRQTVKLTSKDEERMRKSIAAPDIEVEPLIELEKREIPWRYTFLNPLTVQLVGEELAPFLGRDQFQFALTVPRNIAKKIKYPKNEQERLLVASLPEDVIASISSGENLWRLDGEKVRAFYYKRDDWQPWAFPMVHSILADINSLRKMKLADLAALDGAMSCIRVWKLGNIEAKIIPNPALINRLADMLTNNVGGGVMDLVWGPDIELVETKSDVHQFLGETKYNPVLTAIYAGLGVPPTLTGASPRGGFTNNFISLQTLCERLEYGRSVAKEFWEHEIRLVQRAMGFRFPATLVFDRMTLTDSSSEKQLLINLADRDLISWESLVERFGETPEIEEVRLRREARKRKSKQMRPKAGPFHNGEHEFAFEKIFAQTGVVTPSELGVELQDRVAGEKTPLDIKGEQAAKMQKEKLKVGVQGEGRPKNSNDTTKRKQRTVKPRTSASFVSGLAEAERKLSCLSELITPTYLKSLGKKNMRKLTDAEASAFEDFKFAVLFQHGSREDVTQESIRRCVGNDIQTPVEAMALYRAAIDKYKQGNHRDVPAEVLRGYQASIYALHVADIDEAIV